MIRVTAILLASLALACGQSVEFTGNVYLQGGMDIGGTGGGGGGAAAWSPTNIANLLIWHKADSGVYDYTPVTPPGTDNAPVSKWDDLSGNAIHLYNETGSGGSPKWVTNAWNGKPVVRFTAASSHYLTNSFSNLSGTDLPATFAFVFSVAATNTTATLFRNFKKDDSDNIWVSYLTTAGKYANWRKDDSGGNTEVSQGPTFAGTNLCVMFISSGTVMSIYTNNVLCVSAAQNVAACIFNCGYVGKSGANYMNGDIGEIVIYGAALSDADRTNLFNYFDDRWAIQ